MIPKFRAKKIDSDEYIEGNIITIQKVHYIQYEIENECELLSFENGELELDDVCEIYPIDLSTISIHFPDMLDSQGNKIFASLQEDGKGGDILKVENGCEHIPYYRNGHLTFFDFPMMPNGFYNRERTKIIGIQQ